MTPEKIREYRLRAGANEIYETLQLLEPYQVIVELYLPVENPIAKKLYAHYEKMFVQALNGNKRKFVEKDYVKSQKEITKWIQKENHWRIFADFSMYVIRNLKKKSRSLFNAFASALMDTWALLPNYGLYWYGLDENDSPLFCKELYGAYDIEAWKLFESIDRARISGKLTDEKKIEYALKVDLLDKKTEFVRLNERNITNVIFDMIGLIDTENEDFIYPKEWFNHHNIVGELPRIWKSSDYYWDMFQTRSYLLDTDGVIVECFNAGLFKQIRLKEEFLNDGLVLLYNVTSSFEDKETMGFIDLRNNFAYSVGLFSDNTTFANNFINFILEVYAKLTCDFEVKTNRLVALKVMNDITELGQLNDKQPAIFCHTKEVYFGVHKGERKVTQKLFHKVKPFLRKGNPSELAIANARKYGIILPAGYTFVREHTRGKLF